MFKKTITYEDYDGATRSEDFYFNLSRADLIEWEADKEESGGVRKIIDNMVHTQDPKQIIRFIKELVMLSYGEKSPDGRRFIKSEELSTAFTQTEAYSELLMDFTNNPDSLIDFVNGIIPKNLRVDISDEDAEAYANGSVTSDDLAKKYEKQIQRQTKPKQLKK